MWVTLVQPSRPPGSNDMLWGLFSVSTFIFIDSVLLAGLLEYRDHVDDMSGATFAAGLSLAVPSSVASCTEP